MKKVVLMIEGMTCSACSNGLEKYINKQSGIYQANVNLVMRNAMIEYDDNILTIPKIEKIIEEAGFHSLGLWNEASIKENSKLEIRKCLFYTILIIMIFYITMGHMIGLPMIPIINPHMYPINYIMVLIVFTGIFLFYGFDILKNGLKNLIHKTPNMDTLVSIGITCSILYSLYHTYQIAKGNTNSFNFLYFDSVCMMIYFIKLGRHIDQSNQNKTKEAIQQLVQITPKSAIMLKDGKEQRVTIDEIQKGDIIMSRPGEKIAVDGILTKGIAHLDESFITGESKAVKKGIGDSVVAGSINYDGYLEYQAERIGADSTISEIVKLVIEATNTKAPIASLADKVSSYFVPLIILLSFLSFFIYLCLGMSFKDALNTFVTILVVACPCSLGLATPLAIVISEGICASNGILVKKSEILENAGKVNTVVLDKTGTITYGTPNIETILLYENINELELMQKVGSIEEKSTHPISKAFKEYMNIHHLKPVPIDRMEEIGGYGLIGEISGNQILIGNEKLLRKFKIQQSVKKQENYSSIVYVAQNGKLVAEIQINDIVRENVHEVIQQLKKMKIDVIMLTGDHSKTASYIAKRVGIANVVSDVLPSSKASFIRQLKQENRYVMMCGDGINDSPALASTDIGVSLHSGSDIATNSADVILTSNDLHGILNLIIISKKTLRNIKQNLFWAFFYNLLMIPIAIGILRPIGITMNPMIAAIAMTFSSFTVVMNALRLRNIKINN